MQNYMLFQTLQLHNDASAGKLHNVSSIKSLSHFANSLRFYGEHISHDQIVYSVLHLDSNNSKLFSTFLANEQTESPLHNYMFRYSGHMKRVEAIVNKNRQLNFARSMLNFAKGAARCRHIASRYYK